MDAAESGTLERVLEWARGDDLIRAVLLEGSRANPQSKVDSFSDFDILLVVTDRERFANDRAWEGWLGEPLISWDDMHESGGVVNTMRLVIYEDGTRIDYCFWPAEALDSIRERGTLPPIADTGYRVLLDKDGITAGLPAPSGVAHVPAKPAAAEFQRYVDDFWLDAAYVAKNLCRDQLLPAKHGLNTLIAQGHLRRLLDWLASIKNGWALPAGRHGRHLRQRTEDAYWSRLESLFVGAGHGENWEALSRALSLHRDLAMEVAKALNFEYPIERDAKVVAYLMGLRTRDRLAAT